jgi:hypothetical protein
MRVNPYWSRWMQQLRHDISDRGIDEVLDTKTFTENIIPNRESYGRWATTCEEMLWGQESHPLVVEFGAGYGGMSDHWHPRITFINIDLEMMLEVEHWYLKKNGTLERATLVPFEQIETVDFAGAYFFRTYALTETLPEVWEFCFENVFPNVRGVYIRGSQGWGRDEGVREWPWQQLRERFREVSFQEVREPPHVEYEFVGVNDG